MKNLFLLGLLLTTLLQTSFANDFTGTSSKNLFNKHRSHDCRDEPKPECRYDSHCSSGYTCIAGSCIEQQKTCVPRCTSYYPGDYYIHHFRGQCETYGADYCGANPSCTSRCTSRFPNDYFIRDLRGECETYSADTCRG